METTSCGGNLRPLKGCAQSGYTSDSSSVKSTWIQRLIPAQVTRAEWPPHTKSLHNERQGLDGSQDDWTYDGVFISDIGKQSDFLFYENSRRSKQDFSSQHEALQGNNTAHNGHNSVKIPASTSRIQKSVEAWQPKTQVPPRTLPIVESLLNTGCSKNVVNPQAPMEINTLHNWSKCFGFSNPIKQTVHFSADEKSRVSRSSINKFNPHKARYAAGDSNESLMDEKCFNATHPTMEFTFNHFEKAMRLNTDLVHSGRKQSNCMNLSMEFTHGLQLPMDRFSESRDPVVAFTSWPSIERRYRSNESRLLDRHSMSHKARIDPFPDCFTQANLSTAMTGADLHVNQNSLRTTSNRNCFLSHEHRDYEKGSKFTLEFPSGKGGAFNGEVDFNSDHGKDGSQHASDLVCSQFEFNTWEKASISLVHGLIDQESCASRDSRKEQDGTSGSFSFHSKNRFSSADCKVVTERQHWPFCETTQYMENLTQRSLPMDRRVGDVAEASRSLMPCNNMLTTQHEICTTDTSRKQYSPVFGKGPLNECVRHGLDSEADVTIGKATSLELKGVSTRQLNKEAMCTRGVNQAAGFKQEQAKELNDGVPTLQPDIISSCIEEEQSYSQRILIGSNWEQFKPSFRSNTCVGSITKWPVDCQTEASGMKDEGRSTFIMDEGPMVLPALPLGKDSHSSSAGGKRGQNRDLDGSESEGQDAGCWGRSTSRENVWLKRWCTTRVREEQSPSQMKRERSTLQNRQLLKKDHSITQGSRDSSCHFDLRPTKRACYQQRIGQHSEPCNVMGSEAVESEKDQTIGVASHFMKRFLTPSAAAMAIMGMTTRRVHAKQPQTRSLFGVWPVNASSKKPVGGQVEASKVTKQNKEEFLHMP